MKIILLQIGKTKSTAVQQLSEEYFSRVSRYSSFENQIIPDLKNAKKLGPTEIKQKEATLISEKLQPSDYVILLDENGQSFTSEKWAGHLQKRMNQSPKRLVFIVGGAYGFDKKIYQRANEKLALSQMTFSHQIIRAIFAEQLYRAFSILNHEPYHNP